MRQFYAGIDLYSDNNHIGILDQEDTRIYHKCLQNHRDVIFAELKPFKQDMVSISIELASTGIGSPWSTSRRLLMA